MLDNIKSKYILKIILEKTNSKIRLGLVKYNKKLKKNLDISIKDYKKYNQIEIEILPITKSYANDNNINDYINIKENEKPYFNVDINKTRNIINIKIDLEIKSFLGLFKNKNVIEKISFIKFKRKNIIDMSEMFYGCNNLITINFYKFKTDNVTDMEGMFYGCNSLITLNLSNFNTNKVTNMQNMFDGCSSLVYIEFGIFNTQKVTNMSDMFYRCYSLKNINLSSFNTSNVINMSNMFNECSSL